MRASQVFTPGGSPTITYVDRSDDNFSDKLKNSLEIKGHLVSISGPSKSGKTVLTERVVGKDLLIPVSGSKIKRPEDLWDSILNWMEVPDEITRSASTRTTKKAEIGVKAGAGILGFAKGEASAMGGLEAGNEASTQEKRKRTGMEQVIKELAGSPYVVLVDDFHYMERPLQEEIARQLKTAIGEGVKICTAAVSHRGDDVLRANNELRGRLSTIDLPYWRHEDLVKIAQLGFHELNAKLETEILTHFANEAAGSPQLMQLICLQTCFNANLRERKETATICLFSDEFIHSIYEQTTAAADFRSLFDTLDCGPKLRGKDRKIYKFSDGSSGDVYRSILKAVAANPPALSFPYDDLLERMQEVCDGERPSGSSITGSCQQMVKLAVEKYPNERSIDWNEERELLDIVDPYLLFYLRWAGRLNEEV